MTRILVAEDDSAVRQVIKETLAAQGYQIIEAENGAKAYELTAEAAVAERPDLIVLDIMMPQMNGFEVLEKLKANPQTAYIPVVIVSARNQTQDETRAMRAGASDYITKPWSPGDLESRVKLALDHRRSSKPSKISLSRQR
ncbi:MAG: response regulator [Chloroflexi bacterium]|nr:response regulator [Chloroflexota bacterium]